MISSAQRLTKEGVPMHEFVQSVPNLTESSQNLYDLIKGRNFKSYPSEEIRLAVSRAVAIEGQRGWRIGKDKQTHKIDVVVALAMPALAAVKREADSGIYPLSVWMAANGTIPEAALDLDGSREWRDKRCPPEVTMEDWVRLTGATRPTSGPEALGAIPLGDGAYRAATLSERWEIEARTRARESEMRCVMINVSAALAKQRAEAAAADAAVYAAGTARTRRAPVVLTDRQSKLLDGFCAHVRGTHKRKAFRDAVLIRLSGSIGDAALRVAIAATALDIGFTTEQLRKCGIFSYDNKRGAYALPGSGKAAQGIQL
jgi:hypothetical protein